MTGPWAVVCFLRGLWRRLLHRGPGRPTGCLVRPVPGALALRCRTCRREYRLTERQPPRVPGPPRASCAVCGKKARKAVVLGREKTPVCGAWCGQKVAKRGAA